MKMLVLPRDPNPYQGLLYGAMGRLGVRIRYLGELTRSHTVNVLLLPAELTWHRMAGTRVVHLHWVFRVHPPRRAAVPGAPAARRKPGSCSGCGRAARSACGWCGRRTTCSRMSPVFADDVAARRALVRASDLVLAHSPAALAELAALGAVAAAERGHRAWPAAPGHPGHLAAPARLPGRTAPVPLLRPGSSSTKESPTCWPAFAGLAAETAAELTVAGQCPDRRLRAELHERWPGAGHPVTLHLDWVPDAEVPALLAAADVVVLPFRRVSTSGSALLALCHGRPLIVPDLPGLADLPGPGCAPL